MFNWFAELLPKNFFLIPWKEIDREAGQEREACSRYDYRPLWVFCTAALCLSVMEYFGGSEGFERFIRYFALSIDLHHPYFELYTYVWWAAWRVLGYLLIPALVVLFVFREKLRDYGLGLNQAFGHWRLYLLCLLIVTGCVLFASTQESFLLYYPFYSLAGRSWFDLLLWEGLYLLQFFSLEFFFRGFFLRGCKAQMGSHAIFAMIVPYCMIHFSKPFIEVLAAIIAGLVLGTLAMRTKSIWLGFLLHCVVALGMDLASLQANDDLPRLFFPIILAG